MRGRFAAAAAIAWLAACSPATEEAAQEGIATPELPADAEDGSATVTPSPTRPPPMPVPSNAIAVGDLAGEYRIAGVDGGDINQPYAITASIDGNRIHVVADCINMAWRYSYAEGRLATTRVPVEGCARGLTDKEEAILSAFDGATQAVRTPANGIELSGGGHSVTLFSQ